MAFRRVTLSFGLREARFALVLASSTTPEVQNGRFSWRWIARSVWALPDDLAHAMLTAAGRAVDLDAPIEGDVAL